MGKKIKTKQKKMMTCQDLPTELPMKFIPSVNLSINLFTLFIISITKGITDEQNSSVFSRELRIVHFPIALLIVVLYGQNHRWNEKLSVLFGSFLKKFN
jgi:hypothetical protein